MPTLRRSCFQLGLPVEALDRFDALALRILEETGIHTPDAATLTAARAAGLSVSEAEGRIRFPPQVAESLMQQVPRSFVIGGRDRADDLELGPDSLLVRPQSGCPNVLDLETGSWRPARLSDVAAMARLNDGLPNLQLAASLIYPSDVGVQDREVVLLATMLKNTRKHIYIQPFGAEGAARMGQLAEVLRGGSREVAARPPFTFITAPTSPLVTAPNELAILRTAAARGLPVMFGSTPIRGATGPITLAGQVVLHHAECLAGAVLSQVFRPGTPITYGIRPSGMDMRYASPIWGGVEWGMVTAALTQLARRRGMLTDVVGLPTDSKLPDEQAGLEKGFNAAFAALSGGNVVAGAGYLDFIMTGSFEQLVIDDDIAGMMLRVRRGLDLDDDHLASQLIQAVGPAGNYLTEPHTLRYLRTEDYTPRVLDRQARHDWSAGGSQDVAQRARQRARQLLSTHRVPPLADEVSNELDRIAHTIRS